MPFDVTPFSPQERQADKLEPTLISDVAGSTHSQVMVDKSKAPHNDTQQLSFGNKLKVALQIVGPTISLSNKR